MGTHGLFGFKYEGKYYLVYNSFDSYFEGLGQRLLYELLLMVTSGQFDDWLGRFKQLRIVTGDDIPTPEDYDKCKPYTDPEIMKNRNPNDPADLWYGLLYNCQGSFRAVLDSGYLKRELINDTEPIDIGFVKHAGFVSYIYVLDFDTQKFTLLYPGESYDFDKITEVVGMVTRGETDKVCKFSETKREEFDLDNLPIHLDEDEDGKHVYLHFKPIDQKPVLK